MSRAAAQTMESAVPPAHSTGRSLLRQIASFAPGSLVPALAALCGTVVFTRVFNSAEFGRYSLMLSVAMLAAALATQWLQQGIGRYLPGAAAADRVPVLRAAVGAALLLMMGVVVVLASATLAGLGAIVQPAWQPLLLPTATLVLGMTLVDPLSVMLQSSLRGARYSLYRAADALLRLVLGVAAVLFVSRSVAALLWATALAPLLLAPILWRDAGVPGLTSVGRRVRALRPEIVRLMSYGLPMLGWFVASYILHVSDRYVIQWFRGAAEVGIYAANYSLASGVGGLLAAPVLLAVHPRLMRAWDEGDTRAAEKWLGRIVETFVILGLLLSGVLLLISPDVASLLLGAEFREGHRVIPVAMAGVIMWQLGLFTQKPLEFTERVRTVMMAGLGAALFNIAANIVFVPHYGYMAAAWTTLASYLAYVIATGWLGWRIMYWRLRWGMLAGCAGILGAGLGAAALIRTAGVSVVGAGASLVLAVAAAALACGWVLRRAAHVMLSDE